MTALLTSLRMIRQKVHRPESPRLVATVAASHAVSPEPHPDSKPETHPQPLSEGNLFGFHSALLKRSSTHGPHEIREQLDNSRLLVNHMRRTQAVGLESSGPDRLHP